MEVQDESCIRQIVICHNECDLSKTVGIVGWLYFAHSKPAEGGHGNDIATAGIK